MRNPRVYCDLPLPLATEVTLPPEPAAHLVQVLRLKTGAEVILFNGDGQDRTARLTQTDRRGARALIGELLPPEPVPALLIHLALGISRGERMEFAIQKAVELGVAGITPLFAGRGVVQLEGERLEKRLGHWRQVMVSACEQCGRNRLPTLNRAAALVEWLPHLEIGRRLILDHRAPHSLADLPPPSDAVQLLIGPEGGLTEAERELAQHHGFQPVRLGPRVLRTETAPLAALAAMQVLWGDFR